MTGAKTATLPKTGAIRATRWIIRTPAATKVGRSADGHREPDLPSRPAQLRPPRLACLPAPPSPTRRDLLLSQPAVRERRQASPDAERAHGRDDGRSPDPALVGHVARG